MITDRELLEQAATAIVQSGAAIATARLGVEPNTVAAIALLLPLLGLGIGRGAYNAIANRIPIFSRGYLRGLDPDPAKAEEKAKQQAERNAENPTQDDTMFRSFRMMMDAVDESAVASIGVLAAQYNEVGSRPDAYFRALGRVLCDVEPGELPVLASLLASVQKAADGFETNPDAIDVSVNADLLVEVHLDGASRALGRPLDFIRAPRFFMLLKRDGLASTKVPAPRYGAEGLDMITIDTEIVRRILATIDPDGAL